MRAMGVFWALLTVLALAACGYSPGDGDRGQHPAPDAGPAAGPVAHPVRVADPVTHAPPPDAARAG